MKRFLIGAILLSVVIGLMWTPTGQGASEDNQNNSYNSSTDGFVVHEWGVIRMSQNRGILSPSGIPEFVGKEEVIEEDCVDKLVLTDW